MLGYGEELLYSTVSLLEKMKCSVDNWLGIILRMIYNSGGRLRPLSSQRG